MKQHKADTIRQTVRNSYSNVADAGEHGEGYGEPGGCCGVTAGPEINAVVSARLGYSQSDCCSAPEGADMGLGCGNPGAIAALRPGEVVLDLGSGGGFDAFLAAREVGEHGRVIGVDMTPAMISKARSIAERDGYQNVEFRLGEIEHVPAADASIDVIISNCVINLSPDKHQVFLDAYRVLKPGGRLAISDVVARAKLPDDIKDDIGLYSACVAGASPVDELKALLDAAGFVNVAIEPNDESREFIKEWVPGRHVEDYVVSATIEARKPEQ